MDGCSGRYRENRKEEETERKKVKEVDGSKGRGNRKEEKTERKRKQKGRGNRKEEETERKKVKEVEDFYFSKLYLLDKRFKFLFSPLSF